MESEDYGFYKGLEFLAENSVGIQKLSLCWIILVTKYLQVSDLGYDQTFSTEIQEFGVTETRDLIADGRNVIVSVLAAKYYLRGRSNVFLPGD